MVCLKDYVVTTQSNILCNLLTVGGPTINPDSRFRQSPMEVLSFNIETFSNSLTPRPWFSTFGQTKIDQWSFSNKN